jgi:glycosyltransferase involved in cell wall biosynthesis
MEDIYINARFLTQEITGVQRFAIELCKELLLLNPNIKFIAPKHILHEDLIEKFDVITCGKFNSHLWEQIELPRFLAKKNNPLLINLCNTAPIRYKNQIVTVHDVAFLVNPSWFSRKFSTVYKFLIPRIVKNSKKIITVSEFSKNEIQRFLKVSASKIDIVHNGISHIQLPKTPEIKENKYGKYLLTVSSNNPRKNFRRLILAFNQLQLLDVKLLIVGSKNKILASEDFQSIIQDNPAILFSGYVSDQELIHLYKNAHLFIYPSLYEGFGIPPLEAMNCGCPTIVSRVSSLPEVCGEASYYIENPQSVQNIAESIKHLLNKPEIMQSLTLKGYERVKKFSWKLSSKKMIELIKALNNKST